MVSDTSLQPCYLCRLWAFCWISIINSVSCSAMSDSVASWTAGVPVPHQLLELAQTHVHGVSDAIQPSCPLSSPSPPVFSFPASGSFSVSQFFTSAGQSIGASNEYSGLISFRIDWLDLLAFQGTPKSLLQNHSSKALIL